MTSRRRLTLNWFLQSRLKLRHLQLLVALDKQQRLQLAADSVGISQPAASKLLADLEEAMGQALFDRVGRSLEVNLYGAILTRRAHAILAELEGARDEMNALQDGHLGRVAIGSIDAPAILMVTAAVVQAQTLYPRLEIEVQAESSNVLINQLIAGHLDMVLGRPIAEQSGSHYVYHEIGNETLLPICRPDHPLCHQAELTIQQLQAERWVLQARGSRLRSRVERLFYEAGLQPPERVVSTNSLLMTLAYVTGSDAISIVSEAVARQQAACGQIAILPLSVALTAGAYGLILPSQRPPSPATATMLRLLFPDALTPVGLA
ncbi:LysR substrate-binding domain-containing protein [Acidisoma cladoniae]|jgi:DNA-binding transcriptional LysR family regulator|uniref:LysR substrate-binding domain-containing protein n=1 Tax=Acidisoma cladoniae TaxID=3040935 RepID=UPI00254F5617|nr:LysR substrate-binding domain-containing protein [Acidisoma sp. PAMC 29798]